MGTLHGRKGKVFLQSASGSEAQPLGETRSWEIDIDRDLEDSSEFDVGWAEYLSGLLRWSGSIEGNLGTTDDLPFDATKVWGAARKMYLYTDYTDNPNRYYHGTVWPRLHITVGLQGRARFTLDFDGHGPLYSN